MGVTNLWTVLQPTARPTKLETLNRKRLAVDASIWIYQFLKAVRDKEGNALRNSHVVGFFRRICKLLYFGVKPVFVFDGAAPALKRETIRKRVRRREGRKEDAARTAGRLLAVQVERAAEEERERRRKEIERPVEEEMPDDMVYADEIGQTAAERATNRAVGFKKKDQYHLPELDVDLSKMGGENDPRIMSQAELEAYAKQFHDGEDINLYDFSKIDFDSTFFASLPPGDRYNILNAARLRSRLRMGYSKEQLDGMFPDRMAFSRFQIDRVKERNELTQRLMHVNGMNEGDWNQGGRIAGERGREYVLVKNEGVEGGWALGVVSNKKGRVKGDAINLDTSEPEPETSDAEDDDADFEDVPVEGLNRIPQSWKRKRKDWRDTDYDMTYEEAAEQIAQKRRKVYEERQRNATHKATVAIARTNGTPANGIQKEDCAMFVGDDAIDSEEELFEDVEVTTAVVPPGQRDTDEEDDLQKAIALSLQDPDHDGGFVVEDEERTPPADQPFNLQAALVESRRTKHKAGSPHKHTSTPAQSSRGFSGPLPFESLNLGQSLLGKKKAKKAEEASSGGFDREDKTKKAQPMPDWFSAAPTTNDMKHQLREVSDHGSDDHVTFGEEDVDTRARIRRQATREIVDLESEDAIEIQPDYYEGDAGVDDDAEVAKKREEEESKRVQEVEEVAEARRKAEEADREQRYEIARQIAADDNETAEIAKPSTMDDLADIVKADPPTPTAKANFMPQVSSSIAHGKEQSPLFVEQDASDDDEVEWSESDDDTPRAQKIADQKQLPTLQHGATEAEDEDFEDVMPSSPPLPPAPLQKETTIDQSMFLADDSDEEPIPAMNAVENHPAIKEEFIDPDSDEDLMWQLAAEAEEHERFANELNNKDMFDPVQARKNYENELKALRDQQKRDRRDADEVTQTMILECQSLLRYFGLPYITAPAEAEAQCAHLVSLGLVDGIVTDDSDIFLFGGTRVYKNMFNAAKFVECYLSSDLEKEYALDRRKLIRFAHLLGSDYTEGIAGIGPVSALEIISDFSNLIDFREWSEKVQASVTKPSELEGQLTTPFRKKFKNTVLKKLFLPPGFPDARVDAAYLEPEIDDNKEEFQWGVPDLPGLRSFLMTTIGWSQERMDEILVPVIRDMNKREEEGVQSNITRFFSGSIGVGAAATGRGQQGYVQGNGDAAAPRNRTGKESGRMKHAYTRLRQEAEKKKRDGLENAVDAAEAQVARENGDLLTDAETAQSEGRDDVRTPTVEGTATVRKKSPGTSGKKRQTRKRVIQSDAED